MRAISWSPCLKTICSSLLDAVLPPRCPATGALVGVQGTLSPEYWSQLHFIRKPFCACCGNPFQVSVSDATFCGRCMTRPTAFTTARAALAYDDASSGLLLKFKHGDKTLLAKSFAEWLLQADTAVIENCDYLIPVPLHRWRLIKRRYNQSALLCHALSARTGKKTLPMLLTRTRHTESQGHKSSLERFENISGAFAVSNPSHIKNKNLVLVDDVLTSGATAEECAKVLLKAGAARVDVLTLARVVYNV